MAMVEINEDIKMPDHENIFITHAGSLSMHNAEIDTSRTCSTITTGLLKQHNLAALTDEGTDNVDNMGKHLEMDHHHDGYLARRQIRARYELATNWTPIFFCVIKSDALEIVLNKSLKPNHTGVPRTGMLPMTNDRRILDSDTQRQIQANFLAASQVAANGIQKITQTEIARRKALDEAKKKKQQQQQKKKA